MTADVTLQFGDEFPTLACESVHLPKDGVSLEGGGEIPEGYVRLIGIEGYEPVGLGDGPSIGDGNAAFVSDDHVVFIQWDEEGG